MLPKVADLLGSLVRGALGLMLASATFAPCCWAIPTRGSNPSGHAGSHTPVSAPQTRLDRPNTEDEDASIGK